MSSVVDLNTVFSLKGFRKQIGVSSAVAVMFNQRFAKLKKITTSNWSQEELTSNQLLYAANDAYAALKVLQALNLSREELPMMGATPYEDSADQIPFSS
jgi:ribonuclease D